MKQTTYSKNHNTYGGRIYKSDFCTSESYGTMASRIAGDLRFDEHCRQNSLARDRRMKERISCVLSQA